MTTAIASPDAYAAHAAQAVPTVQAGEFLTFRLGAEEYGIDILKVQEIRSHEVPTRIANAPPMVVGVINLRGVIVPLVDLRLKLASGSADFNASTVVIVLNVRSHVIGAIVDSVSDVTALDAAAIKPAPRLNSHHDSQFINGIASLGERMLILIDIEAMLSGDDLGLTGPAH